MLTPSCCNVFIVELPDFAGYLRTWGTDLSFRPSLDDVDVKIIRILQEDPRETYLQIAKDCKISIDSVRRRYARLRKEGIVVREILSLLPVAWGNECLTWLGITTQIGKENEVLEALKQRPEIGMSFVEMGKYNIRSVLSLKRLDDLGPYVDSLKKIPFVNDVDVMMWTGIQKMAYPGNLVIEPFAGGSVPDKKHPEAAQPAWTSSTSMLHEEERRGNLPFSALCPSIDKVDECILNLLIANARTPFSHVAEQIGISTKTVIERYRKLRKDYVAYATLSLNLKKLGYSGYASYNIKVSAKSWVTDVFDKITALPNVVAALRLIGSYNINALAPFSTPAQLKEMHSSISQIPGIERIDVQIGHSMDVWPGA